MSTTYKVRAGDTFDTISRNVYGSEDGAAFIARANPGVLEPLITGVDLNTPSLPGDPTSVLQQIPFDNKDEVALLIDGKRFRFWESMKIVRSIDNMDVIEFGAPFDADLSGFKDAFRPFSYKRIEVLIGGDPLFTGTMVNVTPVLENDKSIVSISGYSLPGVLNDCTPPSSSFPLEFNGQGLSEIAATLAAPFSISVEFDADQGAIFDERAAIDPEERVLSFLIKLAKQRELIISSTERGVLLFQQSSNVGIPVAMLEQGEPPLLSVVPFFSPQDYYSHLTGIKPVSVGTEGTQFTVKNSRLLGVVRPITFDVPDTNDAAVEDAVSAKAGRMFGNMAAYSGRVATLRDPQGDLWKPNTTVRLHAPDAMIYDPYDFIIRSVDFNIDAVARTATLNLVIPGSFSGEISEVLPWD